MRNTSLTHSLRYKKHKSISVPDDAKKVKVKFKKVYTKESDDAYDKKHGIKEGSKKDVALDKSRGLNYHKKKSLLRKMKMCKKGSGQAFDMFKKHMMKRNKKAIKLVSPSKGHAPKGAHGRAAVRAIGRTKTTGNFKRIEKARGKGAAIAAYQNKLRAHQG